MSRLGRTYDARFLEEVDQPSCPWVSDVQAPLQERSRDPRVFSGQVTSGLDPVPAPVCTVTSRNCIFPRLRYRVFTWSW